MFSGVLIWTLQHHIHLLFILFLIYTFDVSETVRFRKASSLSALLILTLISQI